MRRKKTYKNSRKVLDQYKDQIKILFNDSLSGAQISWVLEKEFRLDIPIEHIEKYIWDLEDQSYKTKK